MSAYSRIQRFLVLTLVLLLVVPAPALRADEVVTLTSVADATLQSTLPTTNDGTSTTLRVLGEAANTIRSLVRFDLSSVSSSAAVKVANLRMKVATPPLQNRPQEVHQVTGTTQWTETGVTWTSRDGTAPNNWTTAGGDFSATPVSTQNSGTSAGATVTWPILTDGVVSNIPQNWLSNPTQNLGVLVKDSAETGSPHAILKGVQTGTLVSSGAGTVTTTLASGTDTTKSFLIFQTDNASSSPTESELGGRIVPGAPPSVAFTRNTSNTSTVNIRWYVVEFLQGVFVQRGSVAQTSNARNVTLATPVTSVAQSFALCSKSSNASDLIFSANNPIACEVTSTTNVQLRVWQTDLSMTEYWEVVNFTNASDLLVQKGTSTAMTTGISSVSFTLGTPVDPTKSLLLVNERIATTTANPLGREMLRGLFTGCTTTCPTVTVDRTSTGMAILEVFFQAIQFNTGATVQSGSQNFAAGVSTQNIALSSVTPSSSFAMAGTATGGGQNVGRTAQTGASPPQNLGQAMFTSTLGSTLLTLFRQDTSASSDVSWYVAQMNATDPTGVSYSSREDATAANRPQLDVSILRDVTPGSVVPGISEATLNFTFPSGATSSNYQGALVARKAGASAPTFAPVDGTTYTVGAQPVAGETVVSNANNFAASPTVVGVFEENGPNTVITPNTQYTYKIYTRDNNTITGAATPAPPHFSFGNSATATFTTGAPGGTNKDWSYKTLGTALAPPGLDPGLSVIAGSNDFNVHSMNAVTGARNYQPGAGLGTTGGTIQSRPAIINQTDSSLANCGSGPCNVVYVASGDGRVYAFNQATGQQIWATPAPGSAGALVNVGGTLQGGVAVQLKKYSGAGFTQTTDLVYVGTRDTLATNNKVYGLNGSTGAIVWTFNPGNMDIVTSTPAVDYKTNTLWVSSFSNGGTQPNLWKLNVNNGAMMASFSLGTFNISGSPSINSSNQVVYVLGDTGNLYAVRIDVANCTNSLVTGATSASGFPWTMFISNQNEYVFFTTTTAGASTVQKAQFTYNATCGGETFVLVGAPYVPPSGIGTLSTPLINPNTNFIYVGSSNGNIYKIDSTTGTVLLNRTVNTGVVIGDPSLDVVLGKLYIGDAQGRVYSFDLF